MKKRGELACGVDGNLAPFSYLDERQERIGFDADYCRAIAAAVLGDAKKVKFVALPTAKRFEALKSGEIDVLLRHAIVSLADTAGRGVRSTAVNFIDGQAFVVAKSLNLNQLTALDQKTLCVTRNTPHQDAAETWFRLRGLSLQLLSFETQEEMFKAYYDNKCQVVSQQATVLASTIIASGKAADYLMLPEIISREPLGPYVRAGDEQWLDIVRWTHNAMVEAEEREIYQSTVDQAKTSRDPALRRLLGTEPGAGKALGLDEGWAYNVIKQVGSYVEIYERNVGQGSPLKFARGYNALLGRGGVMYALPMR